MQLHLLPLPSAVAPASSALHCLDAAHPAAAGQPVAAKLQEQSCSAGLEPTGCQVGCPAWVPVPVLAALLGQAWAALLQLLGLVCLPAVVEASCGATSAPRCAHSLGCHPLYLPLLPSGSTAEGAPWAAAELLHGLRSALRLKGLCDAALLLPQLLGEAASCLQLPLEQQATRCC